MDIRGLIPRVARNTCHVADVNLESRSEMMSCGKPCSLHISLAKVRARSSAVFPSQGSGMKWALLVNLSMTTHSALHPFDMGRSVMKSIVIDCHGA